MPTTCEKSHIGALLNDISRCLSGFAMDTDKWITVKPNGAEHKGAHVKVGENGEVKAGMGGKFTGQKLGEIRKSFVGPKSHEARPYQEPENQKSDASNERQKFIDDYVAKRRNEGGSRARAMFNAEKTASEAGRLYDQKNSPENLRLEASTKTLVEAGGKKSDNGFVYFNGVGVGQLGRTIDFRVDPKTGDISSSRGGALTNEELSVARSKIVQKQVKSEATKAPEAEQAQKPAAEPKKNLSKAENAANSDAISDMSTKVDKSTSELLKHAQNSDVFTRNMARERFDSGYGIFNGDLHKPTESQISQQLSNLKTARLGRLVEEKAIEKTESEIAKHIEDALHFHSVGMTLSNIGRKKDATAPSGVTTSGQPFNIKAAQYSNSAAQSLRNAAESSAFLEALKRRNSKQPAKSKSFSSRLGLDGALDDMVDIPIMAAGILYRCGEKLLVLKRGPNGNHPNTWAFPAGKREGDESPEECAARESGEEIAHDPDGLKLVYEKEGFALFLSDAPDLFPVLLNSEHEGYVWAHYLDLPQPLHPGVAEAVDAVFAEQEEASEGRDSCAMDEFVFSCDFAEDKGESARVTDSNGWFEVKGNPLSKVGVYPYRGSQIRFEDGPELDPNKLYNVLRPEEELSSPECIESFRLLPWIDNHTMLGSENSGLTPSERKGVHGVIGEDVYFDDGTLYGNLKAFSQSLANLIEAGKRELSCGYRCTYEWAPGTYKGQPYDIVQRNIRGNHIALVNAGRMGPSVAVLDAACTALDQSETLTMEPSMGDENQTGGSGVDPQILEALEQVKALLPAIKMLQDYAASKQEQAAPAEAAQADADPVVNPEKDDDTDPAAVDQDVPEGMAKQPNSEVEEKKEAAMDAADVERIVSARLAAEKRRDELARKVVPHVGAFDAADMTESQVAAYACKKLGIAAAKGSEAAVLAGYLQATKAPAERKTVTTGMDSKSTGNFVTRHLNKGA